jgi:hypothetical protein
LNLGGIGHSRKAAEQGNEPDEAKHIGAPQLTPLLAIGSRSFGDSDRVTGRPGFAVDSPCGGADVELHALLPPDGVVASNPLTPDKPNLSRLCRDCEGILSTLP